MIVLVDIDHTVSDAAWRDNMMGDWDRYHAHSALDQPIAEVVHLVNCLRSTGWRAVGFTMRPAKWRRLTETWLAKHGLQLDALLMREQDVWEQSTIGKCRLLDEHFANHNFKDDPVVLLDDHPEVCHVIAKRNITVLQVHARKGVKHEMPALRSRNGLSTG